jgi:hypothetical protein
MRGMRLKVISLAACLVLYSCDSVQPKNPEYPEPAGNSQIVSEKNRVPPIESVPFQDFHPEPCDIKASLDPLYRQYITGKNDLEGIINSSNIAVNFQNFLFPRTSYPRNVEFKISDSVFFRTKKSEKNALEIAKDLGYGIEKVSELSIHDSILLSGLITSQKMNYLKEYTEERLNGLYQLSVDEVFDEGIGVCGQYAEVNMAVFNLLKTINPRLKSTAMKYKVGFTPRSEKSHAWNEITTPVLNPKFTFLQTAVDSAQLENARSTDSIRTKEEMYNGLSPNLYYIDLYYLHDSAAALYEYLGSQSISSPVRSEYLELGFTSRSKACKAIINILKETSKTNLDVAVAGRSAEYVSDFMRNANNYSYEQWLSQMQNPALYKSFCTKLNQDFILLIEDMTRKSRANILNGSGRLLISQDKTAELSLIYNSGKNILNKDSKALFEAVCK